MADKLYPHTGWFTQSDEPGCKKEYLYSMCAEDSDYVEWHEKETRPSALPKTQVALIYVARPYLTAIDVTERRNLVYNFRSLLARDTKGHVVAGIYFSLKLDHSPPLFTIFHQTNTAKKRIKLPFAKFYDASKVCTISQMNWSLSKFCSSHFFLYFISLIPVSCSTFFFFCAYVIT